MNWLRVSVCTAAIILLFAGLTPDLGTTTPASPAFPQGGFDRDECEEDCRWQFGVEPSFMGGGGWPDSGYYAYADCIRDCNKKFWKEFDKETGDTRK